jgi:hypothetical protein
MKKFRFIEEIVAQELFIYRQTFYISMNRDQLKSVIKKIVLREMTQADFGVGKVSSEKDLTKDVKKAIGGAGEAIENPLNGKVSVDDGKGGNKFQVEITENGSGLYDVNIIKNGSDRVRARQIDAKKLAEFLKDHSKDEDSYTDKARSKSINSGPEKKEPKKDAKIEDTMEEVDEETQQDIADDGDVKAEEKHEKKVAPLTKDNAPQLGGEIVDKIEKIIDRVMKNKAKAETKTAFLKADSKMESPDKRVVKVKDTPAIKNAKKNKIYEKIGTKSVDKRGYTRNGK